MPLPTPGTAWPPPHLSPLLDRMGEWDAWWTGDPDALNATYANRATRGEKVRPSQRAGGVVGAVSRFFWGRPRHDLTTQRDKQLHLPLATDICQAAADLLYADPPRITLARPDEDAEPDATATARQARLEGLIRDTDLMNTLVEGAELGAALTGHYLRVTWDRDTRDTAFLTVVHADAADPTFRWGRLVEVTFWHVVGVRGQTTWRHVERHFTDPATGNGTIEHALYEGRSDNIGQVVPLTEHPATEPLVGHVNADGAVDTGSPGLAAAYVPHIRPQRRWRTDPVGRNLGRSTLDGVEGMLDALDEVWSSLMRDVDLGRARVIVADSVLDDQGPGQGAAFDLDRSVFSPVRVPPARNDTGRLPIEAVQFDIRVDEHLRVIQELVESIVRTSGFSSQTFGEGQPDANVTATEIHSREQRSLLTRDRMIAAARSPLLAILRKLLAVDADVFAREHIEDSLVISFPESVQPSQLDLANTASMLYTARAASVRRRVELVNPEWSAREVDEETARILAEDSMALPDPADTYPAGAQSADDEEDDDDEPRPAADS